MNRPSLTIAPLSAEVFPGESRAAFRRFYPEAPHRLRHRLAASDLLTLPAIADLAERLPAPHVEYNRGDLPIGLRGEAGQTGLGIGETIRRIATSGSWAVLKNIEQVPDYAALLDALLDELESEVAGQTGPMLHRQAFLFVSSPNAVTPYHFDPEHNILLQLTGRKQMVQFPAGDTRFAADTAHESYHTGGARELAWDDAFAAHGTTFDLSAGDAVYVPVMAPHYVRNGPEPSISLSVTWRSAWSYGESDARAFNSILRHWGLDPRPPRRFPHRNRAKALGWRLLRRLGR